MQLPWNGKVCPLILAPLQGLTHASMRTVQMDLGAPDVLFSEFVPVSNVSRRRISRRDQEDCRSHALKAPMVVQLVGNNPEALSEAALLLQDNGAEHLNINLGCPYGRMTSGLTGGAMLQDTDLVERCLKALRKAVKGGLSVKVRSGYDDPRQIMGLLSMFEQNGIDFIVLHPRTVRQKYSGCADHSVTRAVVAATSIPVIANGDVTTAARGRQLLCDTGAAGIMLGRGAIADPWLFQRLREKDWQEPDRMQRHALLRTYLLRLLEECEQAYAGDHQVLAKLKNVVQFIEDEDLRRWCGRVKRARSLERFRAMVDSLGDV